MYEICLIKPLNWYEESGIQQAHTQFILYRAYENGWEAYYPCFDDCNIFCGATSLEDAKKGAEEHYQSLIEGCVKKLDLETVRAICHVQKYESPTYQSRWQAWYKSCGKKFFYASVPYRDCEMCKSFSKCNRVGEYHIAHCSWFMLKED